MSLKTTSARNIYIYYTYICKYKRKDLHFFQYHDKFCEISNCEYLFILINKE